MKKRLIFDVDDTLIPWKKSYYISLKKLLKKNGIKLSWLKFYKTLMSIEEYEKTHDCWNMEEFKACISKVANIEMNDEKVELFLSWLKNCLDGVASQELIDTLKYLSKKYELVILSNSFKVVQDERMKKFGIRKFFKELYCGDEFMKPSKKAYLKACGEFKPTDCIIIGDNLNFDVIEPSKLGISPIYVNKKKHKDYITIKSVCELKDIL